jgi:hypothetical protein
MLEATVELTKAVIRLANTAHPEDISMEAPGVYPVWEGEIAIHPLS